MYLSSLMHQKLLCQSCRHLSLKKQFGHLYDFYVTTKKIKFTININSVNCRQKQKNFIFYLQTNIIYRKHTHFSFNTSYNTTNLKYNFEIGFNIISNCLQKKKVNLLKQTWDNETNLPTWNRIKEKKSFSILNLSNSEHTVTIIQSQIS